jgi:hypothetical protein
MSLSARRLPKQRVPLKKKLENDKQWAKDIIDYLCYYADEFNDTDGADYRRKQSNYLLYNNIINQEDFERECNPLGIEVGQFKDSIKPYNKTYNKIQVLLGEELKRKMDFKSVIVNSDGIKQKETMRTELLRQFIESEIEKEKQRIMARYQQGNPPPEQQQGANPEEAQKVMQDYEQSMMNEVDKTLTPGEIEKYMATEYQEAREILVQKIINYLVRELDMRNLMNDSFKHGLVAGEEWSWVGIVNGQPLVEVLNPLNVFYHKSPEVKYIQDGEYAGYRHRMTVTDILNRWEEDLSEDAKEKLEGHMSGVNGIRTDLLGPEMKYHNHSIEFEYNKRWIGEEGSYGYAEGNDWEVTHVEWVSRAKVGFLTYIDEESGEEMVDMVSEEFPIPEGSEASKVKDLNGNTKTIYIFPNGDRLEWKWIPEVWEGFRIGYDIHFNIRKKSVQFRSIDNPYNVKLGYHGLVYNNMNAPSVSIMDRMKPYQYLYFIVMHKLKKLIARDRGQVFGIDLSMIDERIGLEKTLYYLEEMDLDLFNSLQNADQPGAAQRGGKIKGSVSRSNMQHIGGYIQLLQTLDNEIGDAAGVTKQREGQIGGYETATNAQQSIQQSSHITEIFFHLHAKHWEKVMNSLVQVCQFAWKGKNMIKQFVLDDLSRHTLRIVGDELNSADFGVYVSNSIRDAELIDTLKQMALPILQNEGKITDIIKIYKSLSSSELEREFEQQERERERRQQQAQEAQNQQAQATIAAQKEMQERQFAHEIQKEQMETERVIMKAEIDVFKFQQDLDMNNDGIPDPLQIEKLRTDAALKAEKMKQDERMHKDKMAMEEKKITAQKQKANNTKK